MSYSDLWAKMDPGFLEPDWLLVIPFFIPVFILLEWGSYIYRKKALSLFVGSTLLGSLLKGVSQFKRYLKRGFVLTGTVLVLIALARPHLFYEIREQSSVETDILLAVDCSKSMLTSDVLPSRLERAKLAILELADGLPTCRMGLIAFAGDAFLECPLTLDHAAFDDSVQDLDTDIIPRPGTDVATAIYQGIDALANQPKNRKVMVLVTDGEDLEGHAMDAARTAAKDGLKIYCVGVGTPGGAKIPVTDSTGQASFLQDENGQDVVSKLDEASLKQIADITGGAYAPLGQVGEGLTQIYQRYLANLPNVKQDSRSEKIPHEQFVWPLGLAILFLTMELLLSDRDKTVMEPTRLASEDQKPKIPQRRRAAAIQAATATLALLFCAGLQRVEAGSADAENAYKAQDFKNAQSDYEEAAQENKDSSLEAQMEYNAGDSAYKAGNYTDASADFHNALHTKDLDLQAKAYYNLGNTDFREGEHYADSDPTRALALWNEALASYKAAQEIDPKNQQAAANEQFVKEQMVEIKKRHPQPVQPSHGDKGDKNQQGYKKDPSGNDQLQEDKPGDKPDDKPGDQPQPQPGDNGPEQPDGKSGQEKTDGQGQGDKQQQTPGQSGNQQTSQQPGQQQDANGNPDKGKGNQQGNQQQANSQSGAQNGVTQGSSLARQEDMTDPGAKSKEEAENLLDSLKDEEKRLTSRRIPGDEAPPPTASGKNW